MTRLARFAWAVLTGNVAVILWGAYVRATGSGAGCGSHWPLCNGEFVPRTPTIEMLIEYSHRLTSGVALLAVVALLVWTRRAHAPGHPARRGALASLIVMLAEAALGAGLVLFQLVADNATMARAMFMAAHLVNTLILLACLTLTAHWASGGADINLSRRPRVTLGLLAVAVGMLAVGMSGAVAALGNTLYPATSLGDALAADLSASSHMLIRLRVLHPTIAIATALVIVAMRGRVGPLITTARGRIALNTAALLATLQLVAGLLNVVLLAPVWMQLVHLLLADALWIAFVLAAAATLEVDTARSPAAHAVPVRV